MTVHSDHGHQVEFDSGVVIFNEGDAGGDLFCIKEGKVEIYRKSGDLTAQLAVLGPGEVLGIMTCLTREPRLASARTLTKVKATVVKQGGFKSLISSMPPWVHTVIKDFTLRIKHMDDLYVKLAVQAHLQQLDCAAVQLASIVAFGLSTVGAMQVDPQAEKKIVDVDLALGTLSTITGVDKYKLGQIFDTFLAVGILKSEPNATIRRAEISVLERLAAFGTFAHRFLGSNEFRKGVSHSTPGDRQLVIKICEYVRNKKIPITPLSTGEINLPYSEILNVFTDRETLDQTLRRHEFLGSIQVSSGVASSPPKEDDAKTLTFIPSQLSIQIRSVDAIAKLLELERLQQPKSLKDFLLPNENLARS